MFLLLSVFISPHFMPQVASVTKTGSGNIPNGDIHVNKNLAEVIALFISFKKVLLFFAFGKIFLH